MTVSSRGNDDSYTMVAQDAFATRVNAFMTSSGWSLTGFGLGMMITARGTDISRERSGPYMPRRSAAILPPDIHKRAWYLLTLVHLARCICQHSGRQKP